MEKKKVFSLDLKMSRDSAERTETGRELQSLGPAKEKARLPRVEGSLYIILLQT